jgi:hypothetical protein
MSRWERRKNIFRYRRGPSNGGTTPSFWRRCWRIGMRPSRSSSC